MDDITQEWTWHNKFDLIHLRLLLGAFKKDEWETLYRRCYECVYPRPLIHVSVLTSIQ